MAHVALLGFGGDDVDFAAGGGKTRERGEAGGGVAVVVGNQNTQREEC